MPVNVKEPLYTVEQLALIKRLRESGITKQQVEYIYESYDRLDKELGTLYHIPVALELHTQALQQIQQLAINIAALRNTQPHAPPIAPPTHLAPPCPPLSAAPTSPSSAAVPAASNHTAITPSAASMPTTAAINPAGSGAVTQTTATESSDKLLRHFLPLLKKDPTPSSLSSNSMAWSHLIEFEEPQELKDFVSQGEAACCEEIRNFVCKNGIKQHQVASLAGVCQTYVSRYMKGDFGDMSERSRKTIQKWYLAYRNDPAAVGRAASIAQMLTSAGTAGNISNQSPGGASAAVRRGIDVAMATNPALADFFGGGGGAYPRRERFVFRPAQLEILEERFINNSYPSYEERLDIASDCNKVLEDAVGRKLSERESVSVSVISNWFANKRKDVKRAAREGGLDVSGMLMSRRGRPPRPFLPYNNIKTEPCDEMMGSGLMGGGAEFSMSGTPPLDDSYSEDEDLTQAAAVAAASAAASAVATAGNDSMQN